MFVVANEKDVAVLRDKVLQSIELTARKIRSCQEAKTAIESMFELRFHRLGYDPIEHTALNFVEQLNQTFSNLVVLAGARYLVLRYPSKVFHLHLGTESGFDIESDDGAIIAECFAVTTVKSNDKLSKDSRKLIKCGTSDERYVFLYSQCDTEDYLAKRCSTYPDICYVRIDELF